MTTNSTEEIPSKMKIINDLMIKASDDFARILLVSHLVPHLTHFLRNQSGVKQMFHPQGNLFFSIGGDRYIELVKVDANV